MVVDEQGNLWSRKFCEFAVHWKKFVIGNLLITLYIPLLFQYFSVFLKKYDAEREDFSIEERNSSYVEQIPSNTKYVIVCERQ